MLQGVLYTISQLPGDSTVVMPVEEEKLRRHLVYYRLWKNRHTSVQTKAGMYEGIVKPSPFNAYATWVLNLHERKNNVKFVQCNKMYGQKNHSTTT